MKDFMVLLVTLPLLLLFSMQFSVDQVNKAKTEAIDEIVYAAKEQAKQDGCFTQENRERIVSQICSRTGVDESAVRLDLETRPQARISEGRDGGLIHYRVSVEIGEAMAGTRLFGINDDENRYVYTIDSYTVSEYLP